MVREDLTPVSGPHLGWWGDSSFPLCTSSPPTRRRLVQAYSHAWKISKEERGGQTLGSKHFDASACDTFAHGPPVKASHVAKSRSRGGKLDTASRWWDQQSHVAKRFPHKDRGTMMAIFINNSPQQGTASSCIKKEF